MELTLSPPAPTESYELSARVISVLIDRVARRDEAAFDELYRLTQSRVTSVVRRTLRCPHQTDEVVQEVFLEIWQRADRFDASRGSALGWMTMMARRRAVDRVRRVTTAAVRDDNDAARSRHTGGDVWEQVVARLDAAVVHAALARLSRLQCEALSLTYLAGYSQRQAAELLAVPVGTFKSRIRDGLILLRLELSSS